MQKDALAALIPYFTRFLPILTPADLLHAYQIRPNWGKSSNSPHNSVIGIKKPHDSWSIHP